MSPITETFGNAVRDMLRLLQATTLCEPIDAQIASTVVRRGEVSGERASAVALACTI